MIIRPGLQAEWWHIQLLNASSNNEMDAGQLCTVTGQLSNLDDEKNGVLGLQYEAQQERIKCQQYDP